MTFSAVGRPVGRTTSLIDVLDRVLDKGIVIEAHVSFALAGIALAEVHAHVIVSSIETHLRAFPLDTRRPGTFAPEVGLDVGDAVEAYLREVGTALDTGEDPPA